MWTFHLFSCPPGLFPRHGPRLVPSWGSASASLECGHSANVAALWKMGQLVGRKVLWPTSAGRSHTNSDDLLGALCIRLEAIEPHGWRLRCGRWLFGALALWSVWAHTLGALWDDNRWNASPPIDLSPQRLWFVRSSPLVEYGKDVFGRVWIAIRRPPTSRSAPKLLSAIYRLDLSSFDVVAPSTARECDVRLCITAVNTGQSVWLGRKWDDKGTVALVWRWVKEGKEVPGFGGGQVLRHDVFPGRSFKFQLPFLPVPSEPGQYLLELEMVSAHLVMFSKARHNILGHPHFW